MSMNRTDFTKMGTSFGGNGGDGGNSDIMWVTIPDGLSLRKNEATGALFHTFDLQETADFYAQIGVSRIWELAEKKCVIMSRPFFGTTEDSTDYYFGPMVLSWTTSSNGDYEAKFKYPMDEFWSLTIYVDIA